MCPVEVVPVAACLRIYNQSHVILDCDQVWLPLPEARVLHRLDFDRASLPLQPQSDVFHGAVMSLDPGVLGAMTLLHYMIKCLRTTTPRSSSSVTLSPL